MKLSAIQRAVLEVLRKRRAEAGPGILAGAYSSGALGVPGACWATFRALQRRGLVEYIPSEDPCESGLWVAVTQE